MYHYMGTNLNRYKKYGVCLACSWGVPRDSTYCILYMYMYICTCIHVLHVFKSIYVHLSMGMCTHIIIA